MKQNLSLAFTLLLILFLGCEETELPTQTIFRGNPISELPADGILRASGSPYLATSNLRVPAGRSLTVEPGVELRFEPGLYLEVFGKITAVGTEAAPITFTSGLLYPDRGDWDGIWLIDADPGSEFEYCNFRLGAKYGNRYIYRWDVIVDSLEVDSVKVDSTVLEYGSITLIRSSPHISRSWFEYGGFHGIHCDEGANPVIENCVFYDNAGHGIFVQSDAEPEIRYNIIIENDDYGLFCKPAEGTDEPRQSLELWYNIVWSNFSGEYNQHSPSLLGRISQTNGNLDSCDYQFNLRLNPAFIDPLEGDYRLSSCSAAIDAGPAENQRDPDGTRLELGIYHYEYRPGEIRRRIPNLPIMGNRLEAAKSPYFMTCDVFLPVGETLTIEPGVEVIVEGRSALRAAGRLISEGTASAPITFTSASSTPKKGDWIGIMLIEGGDTGSVLRYTDISFATNGISLKRRDAVIDHCTIRHSQSYGISCEDFSSPSITHSVLDSNSAAGIYCIYNSSPQISNNRLSGGEGYGILAIERSLPEIRNNRIIYSGTNGIRLENLSDAIIVNNTIARNGYFGLFCSNNSSPEVRNNIFFENGTPLRGGTGIIAQLTSRPVIEYNCFWGHPINSVLIEDDSTAYNTDLNLLQNPAFVDADRADFNLSADSPCIDAGDPDPIYNDTDDSRNDLGAYGGPGAR